MRPALLLRVAMICLLAAGCGTGELSRETAFELVKKGLDSPSTPVEFVIARPAFQQFFSSYTTPNKIAGYQVLVQKGHLNCEPRPSFTSSNYHECASNVSDDIWTTQNSFLVNAGTWTPTEVTGIVKSGENLARADVRLALNPRPFYEENRAALDAVTGGLPRDMKLYAHFQRYDDGWRLQRITQ